MRRVDCELEPVVLAAVLQGGWPERADQELRVHVTGCHICSDVAAIAGTIEELREEMRASAVIPDSGRVWWLAQRRARLDAIEAARRPLAAAQVIAVVCTVAVLGACLPAPLGQFQSAIGGIRSGMSSVELSSWLSAAGAAMAEHSVLALALAAVLLLIPAAACVALGRD